MSALASFRAARWVRTANLVLQALLLLSFVAGINYLAGIHAWSDGPWRYDLTRFGSHSLSPETLAYLRELQAPVRIVVTQSQEAADPALRALLSEYVYATEANPNGPVMVKYLDVYLNQGEVERYHVGPDTALVLMCGGNRPYVVSNQELFTYENGQKTGFKGEQEITSAILTVSSPNRKKIYFLIGHNELRPDDMTASSGLSTACDELRGRNFDVDTLDLSAVGAVPADASLLIAVAPRTPYAPAEQEILRKYLGADNGRLALFFEPGLPGPHTGLEGLLNDWGVVLDDDLLIDRGSDSQTEDDDLIVRWFASHPVTQTLLNSRDGLRIGRARTVRPDASRAGGNDVEPVTIAASSATAWGETDFLHRAERVFDASVDLRPSPSASPPDRLGIAVASQRVAARDNLQISVRGGRLVVVGTGTILSNARIAGVGAFDLLLGTVNWMVDRETRVDIPARPIERYQLSLSAGELRKLRFSLLFVLPAAAAILGIAVYWARRA